MIPKPKLKRWEGNHPEIAALQRDPALRRRIPDKAQIDQRKADGPGDDPGRDEIGLEKAHFRPEPDADKQEERHPHERHQIGKKRLFHSSLAGCALRGKRAGFVSHGRRARGKTRMVNGLLFCPQDTVEGSLSPDAGLPYRTPGRGGWRKSLCASWRAAIGRGKLVPPFAARAGGFPSARHVAGRPFPESAGSLPETGRYRWYAFRAGEAPFDPQRDQRHRLYRAGVRGALPAKEKSKADANGIVS